MLVLVWNANVNKQLSLLLLLLLSLLLLTSKNTCWVGKSMNLIGFGWKLLFNWWVGSLNVLMQLLFVAFLCC